MGDLWVYLVLVILGDQNTRGAMVTILKLTIYSGRSPLIKVAMEVLTPW